MIDSIFWVDWSLLLQEVLMNKYQLSIKRMDIGSAIAVFLVLSLLLLALFCFLTRYFHHKLEKAIQETAQIYSMVDELNVPTQSEIDIEPIYAKASPKERTLSRTARKRKDEDEMVVEMVDLKQPINERSDIYRPGILKSKLNDEFQEQKLQTGRSVASLKLFTPQKINTHRSNGSGGKSTMRMGDKTHRQNQIEELTKHTYINKLVCYDCHGLNIIDVIVSSIRKMKDGTIKEKKKNSLENIPDSDGDFADQLEINGFDEGQFKCYKYETTLEVEDMRPNEDYNIKSLKSTVSKQVISIQQFIQHKLDLKLV